jgi:hypothetical protein
MRRNAFYLWGLLFSASLLVGCSDDEDDNEEVYDEVMTDYTASRFDSVANALLQADDTGDDTKYSMIYGEVLDESTPKVRTIAVNSYAEAFSWFINHCVPSDERENYKDVMGEITIDLDEYGSITYHPSETNDLYASITLNLSVLPDVNQLDIIPSSLWPQNIYSSIKLQSLVYDTKGITLSKDIKDAKLYYICVREYAGGQPGILLCLNPQWWIDLDYLYEGRIYYQKKKSGEEIKWTEVPKYITSEDTWKAIAQLYYKDADNFKAWLNVLGNQKVKDKSGTIRGYDTFPLNSIGGYYRGHMCYTHDEVFHVPYEKKVDYWTQNKKWCWNNVRYNCVVLNAKYLYVDTTDNYIAKFLSEVITFCDNGVHINYASQIPFELRFGIEPGRFTAIYQPDDE